MPSISVLNTDAGLSGKTIQNLEDAQTITGLKTFNRSTNPPFAVNSGAAKVTNLDADLLDGQTGSYYSDPANLSSVVSIAKGGTGAATTSANFVFVGPTSGGAAAPSFRALVTADLPAASLVTTLDKDVAVATVTNTTTETTVYSFSVPGGTLGTNDAIRMTLVGSWVNNTGGGDTVVIRVKYGATTIFSYTYNPTNGSYGVNLETFLSALNATGAQVANSRFTAVQGLTGAGAVPTDILGTHATIAEDSTAAKNLVVTAQLGTATTNLIFSAYVVHTELIG
jgi:hypothetical protein